MVEALTLFLEWVGAGHCQIQDRQTGIVTPLVLNCVQRAIVSRMLDQAEAGEPIRLLIPKARKMGVSTLCQALGYFLCSDIKHFSAVTASHTADGTADLWKLTALIHKYDPQPQGARPTRTTVRWPHGSVFDTRTGGGRAIGRGGTLRFLHISEYATWLVGGSQADLDSLRGILDSVPKDDPGTVVLIESTGQGPVGDFFDRCMDARDADSRTLVFLPWSDDERYQLPPPSDFEPSDDERALCRLHGLSLAQVYWRRTRLEDQMDFNKDLIRFHREFPLTLDEAFEAAGGRVYPSFGPVSHVGQLAAESPDAPWQRYRAIDWGGRDPFVCLWVAVVPGPPGLTIHPECKALIRELSAYRRDQRTHLPLHECSHGPDCLRYAVTTWRLYGHVYVYRELYAPHHAKGGPNLLALCEQVHALSGWREVAPHVWQPAEGAEDIVDTVADRSRTDSIQLFCDHGLSCAGQINLQTHRYDSSGLSTKGEVEQGIDQVTELIVATVPLEQPRKPKTEIEVAYQEMQRPSRLAVAATQGLEGRLLRDEARRWGQSRIPKRNGRRHGTLGAGF